MRKFNVFLIFMFFASLGNSQSAKIEFKNSKSNGNNTVFVYFKINRLINNDEIENLKQIFSNDINIKEHFLNNSSDCKMILNNTIGAEYIRKKLLSAGLDFDLSTVVINDNKLLKEMIIALQKNRTDGMPEHYPVFINTGNPDIDNANYDNLKKDWMENYPVEYAKLRGITIDEVYSEQINSNHEPQFIDTGNPDIDKKSFNKAKIKWGEIQNKLINYNHK